MVTLLLTVIGFIFWFLLRKGFNRNVIGLAVPLYCFGVFFACLFCHGELAQRKPAPRYLTQFYLLMSLGGVLGGLFNALLAPLLFTTTAEYPLALSFAALLLPRWWGDPTNVRVVVEQLPGLGQTCLLEMRPST